MQVIYKYDLPISDYPVVEMPVGAIIMSIQSQNDGVFIWALIDKQEEGREYREFVVFGTGHPIEEDLDTLTYLESVMSNGYVWHIFERNPQQEEEIASE